MPVGSFLFSEKFLFVIIGLIVVLYMLSLLNYRLEKFLRLRQYIKLEIARTAGRERAYWKRELRHLYYNLFLMRND